MIKANVPSFGGITRVASTKDHFSKDYPIEISMTIAFKFIYDAYLTRESLSLES